MCNLAYTVMTEKLDGDGLEELNRKLEAVPGEEPVPVSRGVNALMGMFAPGGMAQRSL